MTIFLDLEMTLINSWDDPTFQINKINIIKEKIKHFNMYDIKGIVIFSFAIINDQDIQYFNKTLKKEIENFFYLPIIKIFILNNQNIFDIARKHHYHILSDDMPSDVFQYNLKQELFELVASDWYDNFIILFDDVVENKTIFLEDKNKIIKTVNV